MAEKQKRCHSTIRDKVELFEYRQKHPTIPFSELDSGFYCYFKIFWPMMIWRRIILEEVSSGERGVMVAAPSQTEVTKTKKRRQPVITDFLLKKHK